MSLRMQFTTGFLLVLAGLTLMTYTVYALREVPYVWVPVLLWLSCVEYAVGRSWWPDLREALDALRERR